MVVKKVKNRLRNLAVPHVIITFSSFPYLIAQMGVSYEVRLQVGDSADRFDQIQIGLQKASVRMVIRKVKFLIFKFFDLLEFEMVVLLMVG